MVEPPRLEQQTQPGVSQRHLSWKFIVTRFRRILQSEKTPLVETAGQRKRQATNGAHSTRGFGEREFLRRLQSLPPSNKLGAHRKRENQTSETHSRAKKRRRKTIISSRDEPNTEHRTEVVTHLMGAASDARNEPIHNTRPAALTPCVGPPPRPRKKQRTRKKSVSNVLTNQPISVEGRANTRSGAFSDRSRVVATSKWGIRWASSFFRPRFCLIVDSPVVDGESCTFYGPSHDVREPFA